MAYPKWRRRGLQGFGPLPVRLWTRPRGTLQRATGCCRAYPTSGGFVVRSPALLRFGSISGISQEHGDHQLDNPHVGGRQVAWDDETALRLVLEVDRKPDGSL